MKITIFGAGYVGLVSGACFADAGNEVVCVDINEARVQQMQQGISPIYEPGLSEMLKRNIEAGRIQFTTDAASAIEQGEFLFIAVGTPSDEDGSADLQYVLNVANTIGEHIDSHKIIVTKSTVPVGTSKKVEAAIQAALNKRNSNMTFSVASNPEFLREGNAIQDFVHGDRIVVGASDNETFAQFEKLYQPFVDNGVKLIKTDITSSELIKYASNAFLATKISFINEVANLAEKVGANIDAVRVGMGTDPRIGERFLLAGCGYGGSCFPKDVLAMRKIFTDNDLQPRILDAVDTVNQKQKNVLFEKVAHHFNGDLKGKTFAVWGLAFKPNTDDMREAPSRNLLASLWEHGATVQAYDPEAMEMTRSIFGERDDLTLCADLYSTLNNADALVIVTEWDEFQQADLDRVKDALNDAVIFDGRNLFSPGLLKDKQMTYYSIGRLPVVEVVTQS